MCFQLLGPDHPDVAKQFCNLAILCSHMSRYDEVEHYHQRVVKIFEMEWGPDDHIALFPLLLSVGTNILSGEIG